MDQWDLVVTYGADGAPSVAVGPRNRYLPHLLRDYAARCAEAGRPDLAERARADADRIGTWQGETGDGALPGGAEPQPAASPASPDPDALTLDQARDLLGAGDSARDASDAPASADPGGE